MICSLTLAIFMIMSAETLLTGESCAFFLLQMGKIVGL